MNGRTHRKIGTAAGAVAAFSRSNPSDDLIARALETAGGALAGNLGARAPDWFEPAVHSHHRSTLHSVAAGAKLYAAAKSARASWEERCRAKSNLFAARIRDPAVVGMDKLKCFFLALFWRMAAGFISGASAGYLSHLALDASTPRGLPLLTRGF